MSDAIISTDENFRIKTWNKAAEKIYGVSLSEVKNKKTNEVLPYEFLNDSFEQARKKLIEEGQWTGIVAFTRRDWSPLAEAFLEVLRAQPWQPRPRAATDVG